VPQYEPSRRKAFRANSRQAQYRLAKPRVLALMMVCRALHQSRRFVRVSIYTRYDPVARSTRP